MVNGLGGLGGETKRPVAVAMTRKDELKPELGNQDRREGNGDERYPCREISKTW